jgi:hypothetical protein
MLHGVAIAFLRHIARVQYIGEDMEETTEERTNRLEILPACFNLFQGHQTMFPRS